MSIGTISDDDEVRIESDDYSSFVILKPVFLDVDDEHVTAEHVRDLDPSKVYTVTSITAVRRTSSITEQCTAGNIFDTEDDKAALIVVLDSAIIDYINKALYQLRGKLLLIELPEAHVSVASGKLIASVTGNVGRALPGCNIPITLENHGRK